jgi:hypothetical protein
MCAAPTQTSTGMAPINTKRPTSAPIISGRRLRRSTRTPNGKVATRNGRNCAARRSPISVALADSVMIARSGSASSPISEPNHETVDPNHSRRKFGMRQALSRRELLPVSVDCSIIGPPLHRQSTSGGGFLLVSTVGGYSMTGRLAIPLSKFDPTDSVSSTPQSLGATGPAP